jgi:Mn-containing catalase
MNLTLDVGFAMGEVNKIQQYVKIHYQLIDNQPIMDLLIDIGSEINTFIDLLNPQIFPSTVSYLLTYCNKGKSTVAFTSLLSY